MNKLKPAIIALLWSCLFFILSLGQLEKIPFLFPSVYFHDILIALLLCLGSSSFIRYLRQGEAVLSKPMLACAGTLVISLVLNAHRYHYKELLQAFLYTVRWIMYASVYFLILFLHREKYIKKDLIYAGLMGLGLAFSFFGLVQYFLYPDLRNLSYLGWDPHYQRLFSTLFDPNFTGLLLGLSIILGIGLMRIYKSLRPIIFGILLTEVWALVLTYSRSAYLAFLIGLLPLFLRFKKPVVTIFLAAIIFFVFLPKGGSEGTKIERVSTITSRLANASEAFTIAQTSPLFGVGFNAYGFVRLGELENTSSPSHAQAGADNSFLFIFATTGLLGLAAFLFLVAKIFRTFFFRKQGSQGLVSQIVIATVLAIFVHAFFVNSLFYPWVMLWMWMLLAVVEA